MICDECSTSYHLYCLASKVSPDAAAAKCTECGALVPLSVGDSADAVNGNRGGGGGRSGGEKRKRRAVVVSDESGSE